MDRDRDARIRAKAHELWEREGRPAWQQERHWDEAKALIEAEEGMSNSRLPIKSGTDPVAEPAISFQNQGDFPSLTDQVETPAGPDFSALPKNRKAPGRPRAKKKSGG
jgi:hypothetical protein